MKTVVLKGTPLESGAQLSENVLETPLRSMIQQQPDVADAMVYGILSRLMALGAAHYGIPRSIQLLDMVKSALQDAAKSPIATMPTDGEVH